MDPSRLLALWRRLGGTGPGRWLFSRLLGWGVPYSGSIRATVESLAPGACALTLRERRAVRNHLGSVHAIALINLAELASGLAMLSGLPTSARGIVTHIEMDYLKKARGLLRATSEAQAPEAVTESLDHVVEARITDASGDAVAIGRVHWRLGPRPGAASASGGPA